MCINIYYSIIYIIKQNNQMLIYILTFIDIMYISLYLYQLMHKSEANFKQ